MVGYYSQGVPTAPELENNSNQKKYTVNRGSDGNLSISRPVCALFVMGALILAAVAAVVTYFLVPNCDGLSLPESLTKSSERLEEPPVDYVRLPKNVEPTHYRLFISPELGGNFTTRGNVTIRLKINKDTNDISLNVLDLAVDKHSVKVRQAKDGKDLKITKQEYDEYGQLYTISLGEYLSVNEEYELTIGFTGFLNDHMVGFYKSYYEDLNKESRWIASTQFSPTDARRAFPCFDEPSFKAKFKISVGRPANMESLSNMNRESFTVENNLYWDHYAETPTMSSYLVAFTVHNFKNITGTNGDVHGRKFSVWARDDRLRQAVYSSRVAPNVLQYFENYFGVKYPLPKLDLIALPDFGFSAMENWGLITFKETKLLFDELSTTTLNKRDMALTLSHELAHQWFGNLVTPEWWDDLWMKEGFSTYFQYLGVNHAEPSWNILDEFYHTVTSKAFEVDKLSSSRPIHFNVQNSDDIRQVFDPIAYSKGAALVRMLNNILGDRTFADGLKSFINKKSYSNANNLELWDILNEVAQKSGALKSNESLREIMTPWMGQAGYPVVTVAANRDKNELKLKQKRFLINGDKKTDERWTVPISFTTGLERNFTDLRPKIWLKDEEASFNLNLSNWYLLNLNQTGYYIVNYDEENWRKLSKDVMTMPPTTRAQLVSDSMDLAKAGLLDYNVPLSMITTIGAKDDEINLINLLSIFDRTDYLYEMLISTSAYSKYDTFFRETFRIALEAVNFDGHIPTDDYVSYRIKSLVLKQACRNPDSRCANVARHKFRQWMTQGTQIPPNEKEIVYCTAVREEGETAWEYVYESYRNARSPADKFTLLSSLGCASKPWLLSRYLEMILTNASGIRKQDGGDVFISVANNYHGHHVAFDFLQNKWDEINKYFGEGFNAVGKMVKSLSTFMNTRHQLQQLEAFRDENKYNLRTTKQAFDITIEIVKANVKWMEINYKSVEDWITSYLTHYGYN